MSNQLRKLRELMKSDPDKVISVAMDGFGVPPQTVANEAAQVILNKGKDISFADGIVATEWGRGKTVVLFHGWGAQRGRLTGFVEPLVDAGYRVVAVDARAHGDSAGDKTNAVDYSKMVLAVSKEISDLEAIIAHSMGAGASVYALKLGMQVDKLVLLAGAYNWEYQIKIYAKMMGFNQDLQESFYQYARNMINDSDDWGNVANFATDFKQAALIFHDPEDKTVPYQDSLELARNWPNSKLVTLQGLGHSDLVTDPGVIKQAVEFIRNN